MEEIENIKEKIAEFVEKLIRLVPPYDDISIFLRECGLSGDFIEMSKVHTQFFYPEIFSIIQRLLRIRIESSGAISLDTGVGYYLYNLIFSIYDVFDDDDFRRELSEFIGKELPNPLEVCVRKVIEAIKQQDEKMIKIIEILIDRSYEFNELKNELDKRGIRLDTNTLKGYLRTLKRLGLIEQYYGYRIPTKVKRHLEKNL